MPYSENDYIYGPVRVSRGKHRGRIGEFDNDTYHRGRFTAVVKFGDPLVTAFYSLVPVEYLEPVNTQHLLRRLQELFEIISPYKCDEQNPEKRIGALEEYAYVSSLLNDRMFSAQFEHSPRGARVFISHSSLDKGFVKGLAVDLSAKGHQPWVDEWEILAGESIPERIGSGIEGADFVLVVLSRSSVESKWVEQEWQTKYWTEVNERRIHVIPLLIDDCEIPTLLRPKKYVDFRDDYASALDLLAKSLGKLLERQATT